MNLLPAQSSIPNIPFHSKDAVHFVTRFPGAKQSAVAKLSRNARAPKGASEFQQTGFAEYYSLSEILPRLTKEDIRANFRVRRARVRHAHNDVGLPLFPQHKRKARALVGQHATDRGTKRINEGVQ